MPISASDRELPQPVAHKVSNAQCRLSSGVTGYGGARGKLFISRSPNLFQIKIVRSPHCW